MEKHLRNIAIGAVLFGVAVFAGYPPAHVGPDYLYPHNGTGVIATSNLADLTASYEGQTYSQSHRDVTEATKKQVYANYPTTTPKTNGAFEVDHFIPVALGGSNDVNNLWLQPAQNTWNGQDFGFHAKDRLEAYLVIQVKNKKIAPLDAQNCILRDWIDCMNKYFPNKTLGVVVFVKDPDDQ